MKEQRKLEELSFEEALDELESIVRKLETGQGKLEETIDLYERGNALREHCANRLKAAQMRVDKIVQKENGNLELEKFEH